MFLGGIFSRLARKAFFCRIPPILCKLSSDHLSIFLAETHQQASSGDTDKAPLNLSQLVVDPAYLGEPNAGHCKAVIDNNEQQSMHKTAEEGTSHPSANRDLPRCAPLVKDLESEHTRESLA
jgi:hypothetical protein